MVNWRSWMCFLCLALVFACTGCEKSDSSDIDQKGEGELKWVSFSPQDTFRYVKAGILEGDMDEVYRFYSISLRMVQDLDGLKETYKANSELLHRRFTGSKIISGSLQFIDERRAVARIKWGTGELTAYSFIQESNGWKIGHEIVKIDKNN